MLRLVQTPSTWALATDPRVWLLVLIVAAASFGRSSAFRSRWFDLLKPWRNRPAAREARPAAVHPLRDPWFLFLLAISATAVFSWIAMNSTATTRDRPSPETRPTTPRPDRPR